MADRHLHNEEGKSLKLLADKPVAHPGKAHVAQLLDRFELTGPNGRHQCLVTEALGGNLRNRRWPVKSAWELVKQLVEATAFIHSVGMVHGGT